LKTRIFGDLEFGLFGVQNDVDVADHVRVLLNIRILLLNIRIFVSALLNIRIFLHVLLNIRILLLNIRIFRHLEFGLFGVQEDVDVADHVRVLLHIRIFLLNIRLFVRVLLHIRNSLLNIRIFTAKHVYSESKNMDIQKIRIFGLKTRMLRHL